MQRIFHDATKRMFNYTASYKKFLPYNERREVHKCGDDLITIIIWSPAELRSTFQKLPNSVVFPDPTRSTTKLFPMVSSFKWPRGVQIYQGRNISRPRSSSPESVVKHSVWIVKDLYGLGEGSSLKWMPPFGVVQGSWSGLCGHDFPHCSRVFVSHTWELFQLQNKRIAEGNPTEIPGTLVRDDAC